MSRIAVIADIHSNVPALNAVLADIERHDVDEILVNGDLVGRGPQGSAVIQRIRELGLRSSRGNHEDYMVQFRRREVPEEWLTTREWSCARWMAAELSADDIDFIDALPFTITSEVEPEIRLFHGSPRSHSEGLGRWTDRDVLEHHLNSIDEQVLVVAHTHRPIQWQVAGGLIVNVGSVGLPFDGDPRPHYVIFERKDDGFHTETHRVDYDRDELYEIYEETGFLDAGDATAHLLRVEVETARPHLVPFLKWAEATGVAPLIESVDAFFEVFDASMSMREFAESIGLSD